MPAPFLPLAIGVAALLIVSNSSKSEGASTTTKACALDDGIPPEFARAINELLANTAVPAPQLIAAAQIAEANNFPKAGRCLRSAAKSRGGSQKAPDGFDPRDPSTWPPALGIPGGGLPGGGEFPGGVEPECTLDAHMPAPVAQQVRAVLANATVDAPTLLAAAQIATANGFPLAAACLQAEAARRGGGTVPPGFDPLNPATWPAILQQVPQPGGGSPGQSGSMQFEIRFGDRPFGLAKYWTGNGGRFRELDAINPQLGRFTGGVPPYPNWQPGTVITIPAAWKPRDKPLPQTGL